MGFKGISKMLNLEHLENCPWRGIGLRPLQFSQWVSLVGRRGALIFRGAFYQSHVAVRVKTHLSLRQTPVGSTPSMGAGAGPGALAPPYLPWLGFPKASLVSYALSPWQQFKPAAPLYSSGSCGSRFGASRGRARAWPKLSKRRQPRGSRSR